MKERNFLLVIFAALILLIGGYLAATQLNLMPSQASTRAVAVDRLDRELTLLSRFNDPRDIYAHCLCVID